MNDLRTRLARQLGLVYRTRAGWEQPEVHWGDREGEEDFIQNAERLLWLYVADEVLRQMEWSRLKCPVTGTLVEQKVSGAIYVTKYSGTNPLTLAPDDWKPECSS